MRTFTVKERFLARLNLLPLPIYDAFASPLFGHVVVQAITLNLFEKLPGTTRELAESTHAHPEAVRYLLSSLELSGYIKEHGGRFSPTPLTRKWLMKSSPTYLGHFLQYVNLLYARWMYLSGTLRNGEPPVSYFESFGEREWEIYVYGMKDLASVFVPHVIPKVRLPEGAVSIVDLGGAHGLYSIALCKRYPRLHATIVDFPQALRFAKRILDEHGFSDRITLEAGNFLEMEFPHQHADAVLGFNIVHGLSPGKNLDLSHKVKAMLKPGGSFFVLDQFQDRRGSKLEQFIPLMVGINLMNEAGGRTYSVDEVAEWSEEAGFRNFRVRRLRLPGVKLVELRNT